MDTVKSHFTVIYDDPSVAFKYVDYFCFNISRCTLADLQCFRVWQSSVEIRNILKRATEFRYLLLPRASQPAPIATINTGVTLKLLQYLDLVRCIA